ncbi:MAG: hypothetical protein ACRDLV_01695, partial [Solirubrobacteraceae bacterium]
AEGFVIDYGGSSPLDLGDQGTLRLAALTIPPAGKNPQWAVNGDTDGQALVRNPYHGNRECTMQVRVRADTEDAAMTAIGTLTGKLQEACIQGAGNGAGLKCKWTPNGATTGLYLYMIFGQVTDMPVTVADGWFAASPVVTVAFTCKPFLYGDEVTGPTASSGTFPVVTVEVSDVPGDVPAEARLKITENAEEPRRWVEWGLEQRYYNDYEADTGSGLLIESADLVTTGYAGSATSLMGAYDGTAIATTLVSQPVAVCGLGSLPHIGTFRVKARVYATSTDEYWRLSWQEGDGDLTSNGYAQPVAGSAFSELDLGLVTIEPVETGTQAWSGRVEAYTSGTAGGGETGAVDYLALFPVEQYGRLEAAYAYQPGVILAADDFSGLALGGTLGGSTAVLGGTWTTSGATTDFTESIVSLPSSWPGEVARDTTADDGSFRYALLGGTVTGDVEVGVDWRSNNVGASSFTATAVARWTDADNHLRLEATVDDTQLELRLVAVVSGTAYQQAETAATYGSSSAFYALRLVAFASGRALGALLDVNGAVVASVDTLSGADFLATGETLASGKAGFADQDSAALTERWYGRFYVATPTAEPLIIRSGESLEIRSDANLRASADGTTYGRIPSRGSRLFIPPAGEAARTSRIMVRAIREDPITMASLNHTDDTDLAVYYTPRYLTVPRGTA